MGRQSRVEGSVIEYVGGALGVHRTLQSTLQWPPDLFVATSLLMRQTGCYRATAYDWHPLGGSRLAILTDAADQWSASIEDGLAKRRRPKVPAELGKRLRLLEDLGARVSMDDLRRLDEGSDAFALAQVIIDLHAIGDLASGGFGLVGETAHGRQLFSCAANLLLVATGSLSTLGKEIGIVLPKMRTPQSGLTLRSVSHHLSFHRTEVQVVWRTVPWMNVHQDTLNMMLVPAPYVIPDSAFRRKPDSLEANRYFSYAVDATPSPDPERDVDALLRAVVAAVATEERQRGQVHLVVFPELALSEVQHRRLLEGLAEAHAATERRLERVPMVMCGVSRELEGEARRPGSEGRNPASVNQVVFSAFFCDKWYELEQAKHHPWRLDRSQLRQYGLEARLSPSRNWLEDIPPLQRRLSFLAPTGWMTFCPLLCEDLAQLEPVSEVIRGVGPTFLAALLMDGPQLPERWAARYASVLADDPGTAVLSLTSLGMARRSRRAGEPLRDEAEVGIGLWKDQPSGWQRIVVHPNAQKPEVAILTASVAQSEEITADGRSDGGLASVLQCDGVSRRSLEPLPHGSSLPPGPGVAAIGSSADLRELTAATFAFEALLGTDGKHEQTILGWMLGRPDSSRDVKGERISSILGRALGDPSWIGSSDERIEWPTPAMQAVAVDFHVFAEALLRPSESAATGAERSVNRLHLFDRVLAWAESRLAAAEPLPEGFGLPEETRLRLARSVALLAINVVYTRVDGVRKLSFADMTRELRSERRAKDAQRMLAHLLERAAELSRRYG